jgi:hypothetical protein
MSWMSLICVSLMLTACASQPNRPAASAKPSQTRPETVTPSRSPSGPLEQRPKPRKKIDPDSRDYGQAKAGPGLYHDRAAS